MKTLIKSRKEKLTKIFVLVLLAIGRSANIVGLGLEKIGVHVVNGKVLVDEKEQTNLPHIFALGDVATGEVIRVQLESVVVICNYKNRREF